MHQLSLDLTTHPATATRPAQVRPATVADKILRILTSGGAYTYSELQARLGGTETAIAARLRELKQDGLVLKRLRSKNLWEWFVK